MKAGIALVVIGGILYLDNLIFLSFFQTLFGVLSTITLVIGTGLIIYGALVIQRHKLLKKKHTD